MFIEFLKKFERVYKKFKDDFEFNEIFEYYLWNWVGRLMFFYYVERFSKKLGGVKIYFKREDFFYGGVYKMNNGIG